MNCLKIPINASEVQVAAFKRQSKATHISAFVVAMLGIGLMGASFVCSGIATHPHLHHLGMGMLPAMGGSLLLLTSAAFFLAALVTTAVATSRSIALKRHSDQIASEVQSV